MSTVQFTIRQGNILDFRYDRNPQRSAIVNAANQQCIGGGGLDAAINKAGGPQLIRDRQALPVIRNHNTRNEIRCPKGEARATGPGNYGSLHVPYVIHAVGADYRLVSHPQQGDAIVESAYRSTLDLAEQLQLEAIAFPLLSSGAFRGNQDIRQIVKIGMKVIQTFPTRHLKQICLYAFDVRDFGLLQSLTQELSLMPNEISFAIASRSFESEYDPSAQPQRAAIGQPLAPSAPSALTAPSSTMTSDFSNLSILSPPVAVPVPSSSAPSAPAVPLSTPSAPPAPSAPPGYNPNYNPRV